MVVALLDCRWCAADVEQSDSAGSLIERNASSAALPGSDSAAVGSAPSNTSRRRGVVSFQRFRDDLSVWCEAIERDGRVGELATFIRPLLARDPSCRACHLLARAVIDACEGGSGRSRRGDPSATEGPESGEGLRQREPHAEVVDLAVRWVDEMARDEKWGDQTREALEKLLQRFDAPPPELSIGAREYFEILAVYMRATLRGASPAPVAVVSQPEAQQPSVEEFFGSFQ